jgi:hypothetical protein
MAHPSLANMLLLPYLKVRLPQLMGHRPISKEIAAGVMQLIGCSYRRHDHHSCR